MSDINIVATFSAGGEFNHVEGLVLFKLTEKTQQRLTGWAGALHHLFYPKVGTDTLTSARIEGLGYDHFLATHLTQDDINGDEFPDLSQALMNEQWLMIDESYYQTLRDYLLDENHQLINFRHERLVFGCYGVSLCFTEKHSETLEIEPNFRVDMDHETGLLLFPTDVFTPSK